METTVVGAPIHVDDGTELESLIKRHQAGNDCFYSGDPALDHWIHDEEVTIHGGFDISARGWNALAKGLPMAASRLRDGTMRFVPLGGRIVGDMAYLAGFEEGSVRLDGGEPTPMKLRVTMILMRVGSEWKSIHRHGEIVRS